MSAFSDAFTPPSDEVWTLKVAKVALLNRKDDLLPGGKKAMSRKWRPWSVILTGSQLLFFRDTSWATNLVAQFETSGGQVIFPHAAIFKPDELYSVKDAIAVYDRSYTKVRIDQYTGSNRLLTPDYSIHTLSELPCQMHVRSSYRPTRNRNETPGCHISITPAPSSLLVFVCAPSACRLTTFSWQESRPPHPIYTTCNTKVQPLRAICPFSRIPITTRFHLAGAHPEVQR